MKIEPTPLLIRKLLGTLVPAILTHILINWMIPGRLIGGWIVSWLFLLWLVSPIQTIAMLRWYLWKTTELLCYLLPVASLVATLIVSWRMLGSETHYPGLVAVTFFGSLGGGILMSGLMVIIGWTSGLIIHSTNSRPSQYDPATYRPVSVILWIFFCALLAGIILPSIITS